MNAETLRNSGEPLRPRVAKVLKQSLDANREQWIREGIWKLKTEKERARQRRGLLGQLTSLEKWAEFTHGQSLIDW